MWERGSGVLSNFSCHMGRGSFLIWELKSDSRMHNYMYVSDHILKRIGGRKTYLTACSQLFQETLQHYQPFVNHTVQKSKSSAENLSPGCKNILYTIGPTHVTRNVTLNTRPSFCFSGGSGDKTTPQWLCDPSEGDIFDLWLIKLVEPL